MSCGFVIRDLINRLGRNLLAAAAEVPEERMADR
jgi:hypothetical protein